MRRFSFLLLFRFYFEHEFLVSFIHNGRSHINRTYNNLTSGVLLDLRPSCTLYNHSIHFFPSQSFVHFPWLSYRNHFALTRSDRKVGNCSHTSKLWQKQTEVFLCQLITEIIYPNRTEEFKIRIHRQNETFKCIRYSWILSELFTKTANG